MPRTLTPNTDIPRTLTPNADMPRTLTPNADIPRTLTPNADIPRTLTPNADMSRTLTPNADMLSCRLILFMLKTNSKHFQKQFFATKYGAINLVTQNKCGKKLRRMNLKYFLINMSSFRWLVMRLKKKAEIQTDTSQPPGRLLDCACAV